MADHLAVASDLGSCVQIALRDLKGPDHTSVPLPSQSDREFMFMAKISQARHCLFFLISKTCWRVPSPVYCASSPLLPWGSFCLPKPVAPSGNSATPAFSALLSCELRTETGLRERTLQTQPFVSAMCSRLCLPCLN